MYRLALVCLVLVPGYCIAGIPLKSDKSSNDLCIEGKSVLLIEGSSVKIALQDGTSEKTRIKVIHRNKERWIRLTTPNATILAKQVQIRRPNGLESDFSFLSVRKDSDLMDALILTAQTTDGWLPWPEESAKVKPASGADKK